MKTIIMALLLSTALHAADFKITGPCKEAPVFSTTVSDKFETVGDLTVYLLTKNNIPFVGNERGINSIMNSPMGDAALEVISDTEMRAYGWCFFVNGRSVMDYADETYLNPGDSVHWIYSYALYKDGEWKSMCNPSYKVKGLSFCKNN